MDHIRFKPSTELESRYRRIVGAEWDERSFSAALKLARDELRASNVAFELDESTPAQRRRQQPTLYPIPPRASEQLKDFMQSLNASLLPELPETVPHRRGSELAEISRSVREACLYLTLQSSFQIQGEWGLFKDTQSLLFKCCVHFLLPELSQKGMRAEAQYLANVLYWHTLMVWHDDPAQELFLRAELLESLGEHESSSSLFELSLKTTPDDDHDFLTKAQAYWSSLMQQQRVEQARDFALELYRQVPQRYVQEVRNLIDQSEPKHRAASR